MEKILVAEKESCFHCGDPITDAITDNYKVFCCEGCHTVYSILSSNGLSDYYKVEAHPGFKKTESVGKYDWLEKSEIKEKLLTFHEGAISAFSIHIPRIHCSSCIWLLENIQVLLPGIRSCKINFLKKEASITFNEEKVSLKLIAETLDSIGYPPQFNIDTVNAPRDRGDQRLLYRLGVAGFCFGNIMLLSFPDYLGLSAQDHDYRTFFGYLNILLALPVLFFCSTDFFRSAWTGLRSGTLNLDLPIATGILVFFGWSLWEILSGSGPGYMDSLAGLLFFMLTGRWFQNKTYSALSFERDYQSYFPAAVTRINEDGTEEMVLAKDLKRGDILLIRNHEIIPADAILLEGKASVDYSFVTGESLPVTKSQGDLLFAGGRQKGTSIKIHLEKEVSQSYLTSLWNNGSFIKEKNSRFSSITAFLGRFFSIGIFTVAIITAAYWIKNDPDKWVQPVAAVLIVACPCAIALSMPFTFGNVMRILGRNGFYLKNTGIIETLAKADAIVFDKTGTITHADDGILEFHDEELSYDQKLMIKSLTRHSTHPLSIMIYNSLKDLPLANVENFSENPGKGISGIILDNSVKIGSAAFTGSKQELANSYAKVYISVNDIPCGLYTIKNKYREGLDNLLSNLKNHYELHLLSGDNNAELPRLKHLFNDMDRLHFNQSPQEKLEYIKSLKASGKKVVMVGDGLNDAGALKEADAGIAVPENIYSFSPSCDGIIAANQLNQLDKYLRYSKKAVKVLKATLLLSFLYNLAGLSIAVTGNLTPLVAAILMPMSSVTAVLFSTGLSHLFDPAKK